MKEIQYCLFTRHAEDVNFKKIETYVQKIYLKTKTTTKPNQKPKNANDKVIIEEK